ncbi:MAG: ChaN family lipoprotein [Deltaproteobacteria bacterium]|nr:ChaN family lipoprotein [Deltaproteobacteria bacterium]
MRRALFAANQSLINDAIEEHGAGFRRYEARYQETVRTIRAPSSYSALIGATRGAKVTLVGDYHTLSSAQRTFHDILEAQPADEPAVIALEMLLGRHQEEIDRFLSGSIRESTFLRRVDLPRRWPFGSFDVMRPIFDLARMRGWKILGIDREASGVSSLPTRDRFAAERIAEALRGRPDARAFVLVGECHLAPAHLPRAVRESLGRRAVDGRVVRVHQNPEAIWFELDSRGLADEHDVLALDEDAFALFTASPLVCQQSFLTWLEQAEEGSPAAPIEDADSGRRLVEQSWAVLGRALDLPVRGLSSRVEVVGPGDLSFFERLAFHFDRRELRQIRNQVLSSESYYVPRAHLIYLATLSLSHAAEEAAHALRHHLSGEGLDDPISLVDAFYSRVMNEALGFLGSKLVNPKRPCARPDDLEALLAEDDAEGGRVLSALDRRAAELVLAHKRMERGARAPELDSVFRGSPELFNGVTHLLGYILGEQLYFSLVRGRLPVREVRALFFEPFEDEGTAMLAYFELVGRSSRARPRRSPLPAAAG